MEYKEKVMTGIEFNQTYAGIKFVKLLHESLIHHDFKYQEGLNSLPDGEKILSVKPEWIKYLSCDQNLFVKYYIHLKDKSKLTNLSASFLEKLEVINKNAFQIALKYTKEENIIELFKNNKNTFIHIKNKNKTSKICECAVKADSSFYKFIPKSINKFVDE